MEEPNSIEGREASTSRRSSLAGMFAPFLSKQASMDTDTSDRMRKAAGGKIKPQPPGRHCSRSSSGDVLPPDSPSSLAADSSPSAAWLAAGHSGSLNESWQGNSPALQGTPTRGLFSKLLSKKKFKGATSPNTLSLNRPSLHSPSLGASSNGSQSPSSHSADPLPACPDMYAGAPPCTPPGPRLTHGGKEGLEEDADFGSCYSTPLGSEQMHSPNMSYQDGYGDTLDLRQVVYDAHGDRTPMAMRQDLPDVFTPGFNELLQQAGGKLHDREPDTPQDSAAVEPTIALLTTAQLAQAGRMYDAPAMLLGGVPEDSSTGAAMPAADSSDSDAGECEAESKLTAAAAASPEPAQQQQELEAATGSPASGATADSSPAVCSSDIDLQVEADAAPAAAAQDGQEAAGLSLSSSPKQAAVRVPSPSSPVVVAETAVEGAATSGDAAQPAAEAETAAEASLAGEKVEEVATLHSAAAAGADMSWAECAVDEGITAACTAAADAAACDDGTAGPAAAEQMVENSTAEELQDCATDEQERDAATGAMNVAAVQDEVQPAAAAAVAEPCSTAAEAVADSRKAAGQPAEGAAPAISPEPSEMENSSYAYGSVASSPHAATPKGPASADATGAEQHQGEEIGAAVTEAEHSSSFVAERHVPCAAVPAGFAADDDLDLDFEAVEAAAAAEAAAEEAAAAAAAAASPGLPEAPERSTGSFSLGGAAEEAALASEASSGSAPSDPDSALPLPLPACSEPSDEPSSPQALAPAVADLAEPADSESPVHPAAAAAAAASGGSARRSKRSPMSLVRESMPLFLADPSRAMGSPLALEPGEDSLDDQDMQQLAGSAYRAAHAAAGAQSRLLAHGGPQRVAVGHAGSSGGGFMSSLEPVAEASFASSAGSPLPEESPSFADDDSGGSGRSDSRYQAAAAGAPGDISPLRPRQLSSSPGVMEATPSAAHGVGSPTLGMTPGSVFSTPTLGMGSGAGQGYNQATITPQTCVSSAVGSAIRQAGSAGGALDLSPAMPDMPEASPTLMLLPNMGAQGMAATPANMQVTHDGTTPSLLDARAASPSAVYATRFMATPFRGALAALPVEAALAAPLVDNSPFSLREDCGMDTVCLADEAQRVAANLAAAAGGFGTSPVRTPAVNIPQPAGSPGSTGGRTDAVAAGSPTEELRDLHVVMLTKQLAEVQKRMKELEGENLRLREQVEIYEFEKTELNSQEEMEKQARQYAEEQLQHAQVEMQQLMQAKSTQAQQMLSMRQEFEGIQQEAQRQHDAIKQENVRLNNTIAQLQDEQNNLLDRLNLLDMQVTALRSNNSDLNAAVEGEQQRCAELEAALAARDREIADAGARALEAQAKLEKAMEQMIAANTAKEHARQKAADEAAKAQQLMAERQQMLAERQQVMAEREKRLQDYQHLKQKYAQKSAALKEMEARVQAKDAENQELMTMCDQLLQQQEAGRPAADA